ncbi:MAG: hypothetical protein ACRDAM_14675 [Casimicrobium sp.]
MTSISDATDVINLAPTDRFPIARVNDDSPYSTTASSIANHVLNRLRQVADITYWVSLTGDDGGLGTQTSPFRHIWFAVQKLIELRNKRFVAAIRLADGVWPSSEFDGHPNYPNLDVSPERTVYDQISAIQIYGNSTNRSAVTLDCNFSSGAPSVYLQDLTIRGNCYSSRGSFVMFSACDVSEIVADNGSVIIFSGASRLIGNAVSGAAGYAARAYPGGTITLEGGSGPAPGTAWGRILDCDEFGRISFGVSYASTGPATGAKAHINFNSNFEMYNGITEALMPGDSPIVIGNIDVDREHISPIRLRLNGKVPGLLGDLNISASELSSDNPVTVSSLPTPSVGKRNFVSDATVTTFGAVVVGGGGNFVPVWADGSAWRVG